MKERNNVPTWDVFQEKVIILDTIEIGATWSGFTEGILNNLRFKKYNEPGGIDPK